MSPIEKEGLLPMFLMGVYVYMSIYTIYIHKNFMLLWPHITNTLFSHAVAWLRCKPLIFCRLYVYFMSQAKDEEPEVPSPALD